MLHISPESNCTGEIFPHSFVFPYALFTFVDKRFQSVSLYLIFSIQTKQLFYFQLYRQTMGIPSCFTRNLVSLHCAVSRDHIFDNTCQNVTDMRFSICCRRSVIKGVLRTSFFFLHTFLEDIMLFPECFNFFFTTYKIHIRGNFLVHNPFPFSFIMIKLLSMLHRN